MAKFDNVKENNRVWSVQHGWGTVTDFSEGYVHWFFQVKFDNGYDQWYFLDGRAEKKDANPTLFWNEIKLPAEEEDKKPFDLVEFLKKNLVPKEFKEDDDNIFLNYDYIEKCIDWDCNEIVEIMGTIYFEDVEFEKLNILVNEMNDRGVTPEQLKEAYKKLGWL